MLKIADVNVPGVALPMQVTLFDPIKHGTCRRANELSVKQLSVSAVRVTRMFIN